MGTCKRVTGRITSHTESHPVAYVKDGFFVKPIGEDFHVKVHYEKIIWIEAISNYSHIHVKGSQPLSLAINIGKVECILPVDMFVRISRSEIINISLVEKYCGNMLFIAGRSFTVTRSFRCDVFACFNELKREG